MKIVKRNSNSACMICSNTFYTAPSRKSIGWGKFCSKKCMGIYKKGKPRDELFANPYIIPKGKTPWNKGLKGFMGGEKHWNWQGGKTNKLKILRNSLQYKEWRISVFERDNFTCQQCGKVGGDLNADHIKQFAHFSKLRFNIDNGRTLCVECHKATSTYGNRSICV